MIERRKINNGYIYYNEEQSGILQAKHPGMRYGQLVFNYQNYRVMTFSAL